MSQINDPFGFSGDIINLENSFSHYLMSVMTLDIFVIRKYRNIGYFERCHNFMVFLSTSSAVSVKTSGNKFPVS